MNDLLTVVETVIEHHLGEARQIPQGNAVTAIGDRSAPVIDTDLSIVLGTELRPDCVAHEVNVPLPGGAFDQPTQHVGIDGRIVEQLTMLSLVLLDALGNGEESFLR